MFGNLFGDNHKRRNRGHRRRNPKSAAQPSVPPKSPTPPSPPSKSAPSSSAPSASSAPAPAPPLPPRKATPPETMTTTTTITPVTTTIPSSSSSFKPINSLSSLKDFIPVSPKEALPSPKQSAIYTVSKVEPPTPTPVYHYVADISRRRDTLQIKRPSLANQGGDLKKSKTKKWTTSSSPEADSGLSADAASA